LGEQYRSFSSSLYNLLHSPVTSSLLGPSILLNTLYLAVLLITQTIAMSMSVVLLWCFVIAWNVPNCTSDNWIGFQ
jgi:hypothetical protein